MKRAFVVLMAVAVLCLLCVQLATAAKLDATTIKAGLKTAAPEEQGFVENVMKLVDQGKLPLDMVAGTFEWARKKPKWKFQFFAHGLAARAAKIGVELKVPVPSGRPTSMYAGAVKPGRELVRSNIP